MTGNTTKDSEEEIVSSGDAIETFYYAYCNTEQKRVGHATNQRMVAQNAANYHADQTGHETSVDSD